MVEQITTDDSPGLRVYEYRTIDCPDSWLVVIAPGCSLEDITASLRSIFGARLLDVRRKAIAPHTNANHAP